MKKALILSLLSLSIVAIPSAHAQFNGMAPVAGIGGDNVLTFSGTGLGLSQPITARETLSHEYGITLPGFLNNMIEAAPRSFNARLSAGGYGSLFF